MKALVIAALLLLVTIAEAGDYVRQEWRHWIASARYEGLNVREEVLLRDAKIDTGRIVQGHIVGEWADPYSGKTFVNAAYIEIDHLVPLANAHRSGGAKWSADRKRAYANHLGYRYHLLAVSMGENRRKGAAGPEAYKPTSVEFWCQYAQAWASVKFVWDLSATAKERAAVAEMLERC